MDEDAYDLREVSSDVEINPDDAELDSDDDDAEYAHLVSFYSYLLIHYALLKSVRRNPRQKRICIFETPSRV